MNTLENHVYKLSVYKNMIEILNSYEKNFMWHDRPVALAFVLNIHEIPLIHSVDELLSIIYEYKAAGTLYDHWPYDFALEELCISITKDSWPDIYTLMLDIYKNGRPFYVSINHTYTKIYIYDFCMNVVYSQKVGMPLQKWYVKLPQHSSPYMKRGYTDTIHEMDTENIVITPNILDHESEFYISDQIKLPPEHFVITFTKELPSGNFIDIITIKKYNDIFNTNGEIYTLDSPDYSIKYRQRSKKSLGCKLKKIRKLNRIY